MTSQFLFDIPTCSTDTLINKVLRFVQDNTKDDHVSLPTTGNPTCVPLQRITGPYKQEVEQQIYAMNYHRG